MRFANLALTLLLTLPAQGEMKKKQIKFSSGAQLEVEIADDFDSRAQGLMGRTSLPSNQGMLFIFDGPQKLSFWMKGTYIPLSIAYLDERRKIREIYHMKAQSMMERYEDLQSYPSQCDCQYALEVNQGWFEANKVQVGDHILKL
jgi:uncharacterized membrane protein (UPF0127 family)